MEITRLISISWFSAQKRSSSKELKQEMVLSKIPNVQTIEIQEYKPEFLIMFISNH